MAAILEVRALTKSFNGFVAVSNVSFDVAEGEILGLIGPNGSGKSTTFGLVAGAIRPTSGSVRLRGRNIAGLRADQVCRQGVARTFQIPRPFHRMSLLENAGLAAYYGTGTPIGTAEARARAAQALAMVGLPCGPDATTAGLGAAGLKKLEMARALATRPHLLLADESLGGLDATEMTQAAAMLRRIRDEMGITIVWVEHIMGVLMRVVDRLVVLDHGEVIFDGPPAAARDDARVVQVYLGAPAHA